MAYHITSFVNTTGNYGATTNPAANRDNYQLPPSNQPFTPKNPPEINEPPSSQPLTFTQAMVWANFIYTGAYDYCFWDN